MAIISCHAVIQVLWKIVLCVRQGLMLDCLTFLAIFMAEHFLSVEIVLNMLQLCSTTTSLSFVGNKVI